MIRPRSSTKLILFLRVAEWKKRNESRADLASLRDESDHEEYSSILTELAASEIIWKDYVRSALARADPEELEEVNIIAEVCPAWHPSRC